MGRYDKLRAGTLVNLVGELSRRGFTFSFQKYPNMRNKWKMTFVCPSGAKANFSTIAGNNQEMVKIGDALRMGGATFLFNLSRAVGLFGERALLAAVRGGRINHSFRTVDGTFNMRNMTIGTTMPLQNYSGQGLDLIAKITAPRPPAPRWVAFEGKSKMGPDVPFPSLSSKQTEASYVEDAANTALAGIQRARQAIANNQTRGRAWAEHIGNRRTVEELRQAAQNGEVTKILAKVELDGQGNPVGDIVAEAW